jgi:hypothetical protein
MITAGRLVCDTYLSAREQIKSVSLVDPIIVLEIRERGAVNQTVRFNSHASLQANYELGTLVEMLLGTKREPFDYEQVRKYLTA